MNSLGVALAVWVLILGAAVAGAGLRRRLEAHHLAEATQTFVDRASTLVITIAALVLGLLVASAKTSYDRQLDNLKEIATDIVVLDHALAHYGPATSELRATLRRNLDLTIKRLADDSITASVFERGSQIAAIESLRTALETLVPASDAQRAAQGRAVQAVDRVIRSSWLLVELSETAVPWALLIVVVTWLMLIFLGWGLYAPSNGVGQGTVLFCAMVASGAIFLILEMYDPIAGIITLPMAPLEVARDHLSP